MELMKALVLEKKGELAIRDIKIEEHMGSDDVRIALHTVGVCGSDIHYFTHGAIGPFVLKAPMVLGHEASGTVIEVGGNVDSLKTGDRVCMEPGIPNPMSKASLNGMYNLDPSVIFWATPPFHGVMRPEVVHPAAFTFKIPENVGFGEAAMVEPLAVGMHAAKKAKIKPGDVAVVVGAGTIGVVTALSAVAGGCSRVFITDVKQEKLDIASQYSSLEIVNVAETDAAQTVLKLTEGWGADIVFEASGNEKAAESLIDYLCPGGCIVLVGMPLSPISLDVVKVQAKEGRIETIFRYANVYQRALALMGSGKIDLKPLITETFTFNDSVKAYEYASNPKAASVKIQIEIE